MKKKIMLVLAGLMLTVLLSCNGMKVAKEEFCGKDILYMKVTKLYHVVVPKMRHNRNYMEGMGLPVESLDRFDTMFFKPNPNDTNRLDTLTKEEGRKILEGMTL